MPILLQCFSAEAIVPACNKRLINTPVFAPEFNSSVPAHIRVQHLTHNSTIPIATTIPQQLHANVLEKGSVNFTS